jgi:hypothetical protein
LSRAHYVESKFANFAAKADHFITLSENNWEVTSVQHNFSTSYTNDNPQQSVLALRIGLFKMSILLSNLPNTPDSLNCKFRIFAFSFEASSSSDKC